jgi:hypothetical protein
VSGGLEHFGQFCDYLQEEGCILSSVSGSTGASLEVNSKGQKQPKSATTERGVFQGGGFAIYKAGKWHGKSSLCWPGVTVTSEALDPYRFTIAVFFLVYKLKIGSSFHFFRVTAVTCSTCHKNAFELIATDAQIISLEPLFSINIQFRP